jgi:hypothetical protein
VQSLIKSCNAEAQRTQRRAEKSKKRDGASYCKSTNAEARRNAGNSRGLIGAGHALRFDTQSQCRIEIWFSDSSASALQFAALPRGE